MRLRLAKELSASVDRIGYAEEGLRLTVFDTVPYKFHFELQLSRQDAEWLIKELTESLKDRRAKNLPV